LASERFIAINREAGIAAESLTVGVTQLRKASTFQTSFLSQALFNLSVGIERSCKLGIIVDHLIDKNRLITNSELKRFGHDIDKLLNETNSICKRRITNTEYSTFPIGDIQRALIDEITRFAKETRYFNLDFLSGAKLEMGADPINSWFKNVGEVILEKHYSKRRLQNDIKKAKSIFESLQGQGIVHFHAPNGREIDSHSEAYYLATKGEFVLKYSQFYVLQICRVFYYLFSELSLAARKSGNTDIPYINEHFVLFGNNDNYFKRRRTWTTINN
jgi:hypothetical protein